MRYEKPAIESKSDVKGIMTFGWDWHRKKKNKQPGGGYR